MRYVSLPKDIGCISDELANSPAENRLKWLGLFRKYIDYGGYHADNIIRFESFSITCLSLFLC